MTGLGHDIRCGARALRRTPGFTTIAALVLALGIGACTATFSLLDAALIRPLPFRASAQLVMMWEHAPAYAHNRVSPLNFLDWSEQQRSFAAIAAVAGGGRTLTVAGGPPERIPGQAVSSAFFDVLAIQPIAGRTFIPADAAAKATVVVISERLWRTRFGADTSLLGRTLVLDGEPLSVIGVVPADFRILYRADIWTLFVPRRSPEQRRQHYLQIIGRLKNGVSLEQARVDMSAIANGIALASPETNKGWSVTIEPLHDAIVGADLRTTSLVLAGVVAFVLLMACANVANLLLARGLGRSREIAVRSAIGSSRARIVQQLLVETLLLASLGGIGGLLLAWMAVRAAPSFIPQDTLPQAIVLAFDMRLASAALGVSIATAVLAGLAPAWQASSASLTEALGSGGRTATRAGSRLRSVFVVGEVAAAVLVLIGAGLLIRTIVAISASDPGFRADRVLTGSVGLPFNVYNSVDHLLNFYAAAERELAEIPGVNAAALGGSLPLDGWDIGQGFEIVGDPPSDRANTPTAHYQIVSAGYFRTLGIDLLRGRSFTEHDTTDARQVCIVSEEFVRRYLSGREPIGTLVRVQSMDLKGGPTPVVREIVGVARQVAEGAGEKQRGVQIYVPITQNPWFTASIALRTTGDPVSLVPSMKAAIVRVDKNEPVTQIRTMQEVAAESMSQPRFRAQAVSLFATLALLLASVGIFAVLAYTVNQRAREFGIRVALGARAIDVLRLVLRAALAMTAAGIAIGSALAGFLARFLATLLYGIEPLDPVTFATTSGILMAAALAACALPAWKATRIDPAAALRLDA
jgi:putative ABC transport system permease protein